MPRIFSLCPFPAPGIPAIEITGTAARQNNHLFLHYAVLGDVGKILFPPKTTPARKDDLWKTTCFEFFLAIPKMPQYWEFNLSPSGEWNVYCMDAYRRIGFREESTFQQLPFDFKKEADGYSLDISLDLTPIIQPEQNIQIGATAIIQTEDGNESYWALAHPTPRADFHQREGFTISL